ncbi:copper homeostasis protein CutC [Rudanella lutea]|uniref:copper homeostasis protein CutC n=1 Tax=Rudanella lutea TaxID=451374 RepID=UPI000376AA8E|nr:copper homeostasis protein CutC [Rudanella lutea]
MQIEICCYSLTDCHTAEQAGADRIELCGGLSDGGLTPSAGLLRLVKEHVKIPVWVMIRPRGGDFVYDDAEVAVMEADIDLARQLGADGLVLGCLQPDGSVDEALTRRLIDRGQGLPVTFHRAFDVCRDPLSALEAIIRTGAVRILTSGQQPNAPAGAALLQTLAQQAAGRIQIMAGAGVNAQNAEQLAQTGVDALHLSGQQTTPSPMQYRSEVVRMASAVQGEYDRHGASLPKIRPVVELVRAYTDGASATR